MVGIFTTRNLESLVKTKKEVRKKNPRELNIY
jgi:hypothetical protein